MSDCDEHKAEEEAMNQEAAKHGEPWKIIDRSVVDSYGSEVLYLPSDRQRLVACVNALAGVEDPAAAVKAARERVALISSLAAIRGNGTGPDAVAWSLVYDHCTATLAALGAGEAKHG